MSSFLGFLRRNWAGFNPTELPKKDNALRFGLLGASKIAPWAVILPAKTHPEVIIAAVAARDEKRAEAYAKKHGIPIVHKSYQELIDDASIDVVYIPLPNGLHYEWALKSLHAGKHVLLEKPSTSNSLEAISLFHHHLLQQPNPPVLLEAFHVRFHPAWQTFLSLLDQSNVVSARSSAVLAKGFFPNTYIRFIYNLSGGTLMDLGTYTILSLRQIFGVEPVECLEATPRLMPHGYDQKCDHAMKAKWKFPNGGVGEIECDLGGRRRGWWEWVPRMGVPVNEVVHGETVVEDISEEMEVGEGKLEHVVLKTVRFWNFLGPVIWHRIDLSEKHVIRDKESKKVKREWMKMKSRKAYSWQRGTKNWGEGEESWSSYRYTLEEFVKRVKAREGSGVWMEGEDSIKQMRMIDGAYEKAGMEARPTSKFLSQT